MNEFDSEESLAELLRNPPTKRKTLSGVLNALGPETAKLLEDRLRDPEVTTAWITRALRSSGYEIAESTVARYRAAMTDD